MKVSQEDAEKFSRQLSAAVVPVASEPNGQQADRQTRAGGRGGWGAHKAGILAILANTRSIYTP